MTINKTKLALIVSLICLFQLSNSMAAELTAEVRGAIGTSDNLGRTTANEISDTMMRAGVSFGASEKTNLLEYNILSRFDYVYYSEDSFDEELIGSLNADASIVLLEERLNWVFIDTFGQQSTDPLQPISPGNREHVNFFSTGPTFNFLTGGRNFVTLNGNYSRYDYEIRPTDNDQFSGMLSVGRQLRRDRSISLNVSADRTEYSDNSAIPPFERVAAFLRFEALNRKNQFSVDIGYGEYEIEGTKGDSLLLLIDLTMQVSASGSLVFSGGSQYADQGDFFLARQSQTSGLDNTADSVTSTAPYLNNFAGVAFLINQTRYTVNTSLRWDQEDYDGGLGLDRDSVLGDFRFQRELSRELFVVGSADFQRRKFKTLNRKDDDLILGAELGYRISSGLIISLEYQRYRRNSEVVDTDFTENRAFVSFAYTPRWARSATR